MHHEGSFAADDDAHRESPEEAEANRRAIERMLTEDRTTAVRALTAVGAHVSPDPHNPQETLVHATTDQVRAALEWVPEQVFHGSPNAELDELLPRDAPERNEPPRVYASPSIEVALFSTLNRQTGVGGGIVNGDRYVYLTEPREAYIAREAPACIYALPGAPFRTNASLGLGRLELVSEQAVTPLGKTVIAHPLQALIDAGIRVYFVTDEVAQRIKHAQNTSPETLQRLLGSLRSENERQGTQE